MRACLPIMGVVWGLSSMACGADAGSGGEAQSFAGRFLWHVSDCENGSVEAVDPETLIVEILNEFDDERVHIRFDGRDAQVLDGRRSGDVITFRKHVDCEKIDPDDSRCKPYACMVSRVPDLYYVTHEAGSDGVIRSIDPLWWVTDAPWPGQAACRRSKTLDAAVRPSVEPCGLELEESD